MVANKKLLIALDYDGTFTADPEMWIDVIKKMQARGHEVVIATMRTPEELDEIDPRLIDSHVRIVPTSRRAKVPYLSAFELVPDIWIDDQPLYLYTNCAERLPADPEFDMVLSIREGRA